MNARDQNAFALAATQDATQRISAVDWNRISNDLDASGNAVIERLFTAEDCGALAALYAIDGMFRSRVMMAQHGFGRGEYTYFSYPLPDVIAALRTATYPRLAPIANLWNETMRIESGRGALKSGRRGGVCGQSSSGAGHARNVSSQSTARCEPRAVGKSACAWDHLPRRDVN